jgi:thioredoxin-like negative regulator of GroEL
MFRKVDWLTFLITFAAVWIGYYLTLAPEVTLEDSGELATASYYAGIPHSPGYPVWTIYTWLWTVLLPFKNVAWRVALGEATSGALAAGLLGLLVSRGSSMLMEGIDELKGLSGQWERAICLASGFVAGMLLGFNGFMWSQSVIVEVYAFGVASFMVVLLCLLRWLYAPQQRLYLCLALFFHGVCFTNHQTLIVAAIGIEVMIAAANFKIGRELWLGNTIIYFCGLILSSEKILTTLQANHAVFVIYHIVGICSLLAYLWFAFLTRATVRELSRNALQAAFFMAVAGMPAISSGASGFIAMVLILGCLSGFVYLARETWKLGREWLLVLVLGLCWIAGASFYFFMPLSGMTNPPMQWSYPRTVDGFFHAFTRGQYEKTTPSDVIHHPDVFLTQLTMLGRGIIEEFNWLYALLALVPFLFFFRLHRRERAWLIGLTAIYLCLGVLLLILLNPPPDRAAQQLVRVFFTASHTVIALLVGYGLTLVAAYMATHYSNFRRIGLIGGAVAIALALLSFIQLTSDTFFGETAPLDLPKLLAFVIQTFTDRNQYGLPVYAGLILIASAAAYVVAVWRHRERAPLGIVIGLFALMPLHSILTHWSDNEQRNHWFGYWFGHDMFSPPFKGADGKPLYPEMARNTILFGGTDPGRFCPTYMIFCGSFIPHEQQPPQDRKFDRRDVYIITQNALADPHYLQYIRAHYQRSAEVDPPFFSELFRLLLHDNESQTNFLARAVTPLDRFFTDFGARVEKQRRTFTSWFKEEDFTTAFLVRLRNASSQTEDAVSRFLYANVSPETQHDLASGDSPRVRRYLAEDLNKLLERELRAGTDPLCTPERFKNVALSDYLQEFIKLNPTGSARIRLNRLLLEAAYPELPRSLGGVYPDREIYTPTPEDGNRCMQEYMRDAAQRAQNHQLKPGENVSYDPASGRMALSGQIAVMAINGLITKVIFERNPKNDFYVEESLPIDWMYPHLSPFGIIMKINREPVRELTEDMVNRDHEFWSQYSQRFIGNWITYDTPVKDIAAWVEKTYLRRNFNGFTGDRKFVRDDQAQKAFSKLRSAIGGMYLYRVATTVPGTPEHQRAIKEADFAFRQAVAFCPYSPEAVGHYINLLVSQEMRRFDDALLLATTLRKLDPYNGFAIGLVDQVTRWRNEQSQRGPVALEQQVRANPHDFQARFNLASAYLQAGQMEQALQTLDGMLRDPHAQPNVYRGLLQAYASLNNTSRLQETVDRLSTEFKNNSSNMEAGLGVIEGYRALQKSDLENRAMDDLLSSSNLDAGTAAQLAQQYSAQNNQAKVEAALERLVQLAPGLPEAWYDLAGMKALLRKNSEALGALRRCFALSNERRKQVPTARDSVADAINDPRFASLRQTPEFKQLVGQK